MAVELVINGVADTYDSVSQELLQAVVKAKGVGKLVAKDESEQVYSKADFPVSEGKVIVEEINVAKGKKGKWVEEHVFDGTDCVSSVETLA